MGAPPPTPELPDPAAEAEQQRTERHLQMLAELAEIGMDLTRILHQRTMAQAAEAPAASPLKPDPALQFARLARVIRDLITLEARLAAGRPVRESRPMPEKKQPAFDAEEAAAARVRTLRKTQIRRGLLGAVEAAGATSRENLVRLECELDHDDEDPDQLPIEEAIACICRDLGIEPAVPPEPAEAARPGHDEEELAAEEAETPAEPEAPPPAATWQGFPVASAPASPTPVPQAQPPPAPVPRPQRLAGWAGHGAR